MSNQLEEIKSHREWAKESNVTTDRYADAVDWLIEKVERLLYENDNFAHENHSLTGDVSAERERIESLTNELDSKFSSEEVQRLWNCIADRDENIEKLEAENAELDEQMQELAKMGDEKAAEIQADLTASEKKVESLFDAIKHGDDNHQAWLRKAIQEHFK